MNPSTIPAVTYAIGDIHGRSDLLETLIGMVLDHRKKIDGSAKIVFLGDYISRGKGERAVIEFLRSEKLREDFNEVVVLKGNHEMNMIRAIDLYAEGLRKEMSVMILRQRYGNVEKTFNMTREEMKAYLKSLPSWHSDGIRLFTHAGIAPSADLETISEEDLLWYRGPVRDMHGRFVVHGHTPIVKKPEVTEYAANIDTGAYATEQLTCAIFIGDSRQPTFLSTPFDPKKTDRFERELKAEKLAWSRM